MSEENSKVLSSTKISIKPADLRGILEYVPLYRNHTFIISIDASLIISEVFSDIITDIAVLRNLGINIVIVYGLGKLIKNEALSKGIEVSDIYGNDPVDEPTLNIARQTASCAMQMFNEAFALEDIKCVSTNFVRATELGIISGVDYQNAGRVDKVDVKTIENFLAMGMIPIISPVSGDGRGSIFRMNSDFLAGDLAKWLKASKLIYLTVTRGMMLDDENAVAIPLDEVKSLLNSRKELIDERVFSKVEASVKALEAGYTRRAHILDGRDFASLLTELFEKVGCGTMLYTDEYQKIRSANLNDVASIYNLSKISSQKQNLVYRSMEEISQNISNYYVYEMDTSIIAIVSLTDIGNSCAELGSLHVQPFYQGNDVGTRMVEFVYNKAKNMGFDKLFALSTKSVPFFLNVCNFDEVNLETLPLARQKKYIDSGRNSKIFLKNLK